MASKITELQDSELRFLDPFLRSSARGTNSTPIDRPYVTLTYACSLDGMISLAPGTRTTLSGPETKSMTHYLRLKHDAILVGVSTAIADNPSLNCRYPGVELDSQPLPIVIDPKLRWQPESSSVVGLSMAKQGKSPVVIHCQDSTPPSSSRNVQYLSVGPGDPMQWQSILSTIKQQGIGSIMIEGGASILNSLLLQPELVDAVIVTIAPTWLGQGGVHVSPSAQKIHGQRMNAATLTETAWKQFGADVVLCGRLNP